MTGLPKLLFAAAAALVGTAALAQVQDRPALGQFDHAPTVQGSWLYRAASGGSEAIFADTRGTVRITLRCMPATRQVTLSRLAAAPAASMFVWTSSRQRSIAASTELNPIRVSAVLAAADPLLDAIAFSRGRFALSVPGSTPLVVVPGPEAARVFEDCRI